MTEDPRNKFISIIGERTFNRKKFSNVTFVVNKRQYYGCRSIMSAASKEFEHLLNEHFSNCTDQEVPVTGIQHHESFFNMLKYIHGVTINYQVLSKEILCDMLQLSDHYKLEDLHNEIIKHLGRLKQYKLNSIVVMLNTAKKFNLSDFYEELKLFVYQHAELVVKHKSFVNIQYDVLLELLKSDWLYCKEIDILRAALEWHNQNVIDNMEEMEVEESDLLTEVDAIDPGDDKDGFVGNLLGNYNNFFELETTNHEKNMKNKNINVLPVNLVHKEDLSIAENNENGHIQHSEELCNRGAEAVLFSRNILYIILKNIRFSRISMHAYSGVIKTEVFRRYKDILLGECENIMAYTGDENDRAPLNNCNSMLSTKNEKSTAQKYENTDSLSKRDNLNGTAEENECENLVMNTNEMSNASNNESSALVLSESNDTNRSLNDGNPKAKQNGCKRSTSDDLEVKKLKHNDESDLDILIKTHAELFALNTLPKILKFVLLFEIKGMKEDKLVEGESLQSQKFEIGACQWHILAKVAMVKNEKYLGLYLAVSFKERNITVDTRFQISLIQNDFNKKMTRKSETKFVPGSINDWGWGDFIKISDLFYAKYVSCETITILADITKHVCYQN